MNRSGPEESGSVRTIKWIEIDLKGEARRVRRGERPEFHMHNKLAPKTKQKIVKKKKKNLLNSNQSRTRSQHSLSSLKLIFFFFENQQKTSVIRF